MHAETYYISCYATWKQWLFRLQELNIHPSIIKKNCIQKTLRKLFKK